MRIFIPILLILFFYSSCKNDISVEESQLSKEIKINQKKLSEFKVEKLENRFVSETQRINQIDSNGWKQGKHVVKNKWGKVIEEATYKNDTIVGYYRYWDGMQKDGFYVNGKKHGNFNWYYGDGTILLISHYVKDSAVWHAPYIANQTRTIPIKSFTIEVDSIYVEIPHPNDQRWYEGMFIDKKPIGTHKIYTKTGNLKASIDHEKGIYTYFDSTLNRIDTNKLIHEYW